MRPAEAESEARTAPAVPPAVSRRAGRHRLPQTVELVLHLARREIAVMHRFTLLGWLWPLARQLAQLGVLVLVFGSILDLGIPNYPVYVFSGLIAWSWFTAGLSQASTCLLSQRHLVFKAGFPTIVLPAVSVAVPLVDVVMAVPVLVAMLIATDELRLSALAFPLILMVQLVMTCGLAWLAGAATVYLRDVPNIIAVLLNILFYLTPVFYATDRVPAEFRNILRFNPMTTLLDADRAALLGSPFPSVRLFVIVTVLSVVLAGVGLLVFRRLSPGFVDEL